MTRYLKLAMLAVLALVTFAPAASARQPVVVLRGYYGPVFYRPWPYWNAYGPGWGWPYGYAPAPTTGGVKFDSKTMKDAAVYVDGGYAGTVGKLKTFPLSPGTHDIELRNSEAHPFYQERIDVIAGKTIELHPDYK